MEGGKHQVAGVCGMDGNGETFRIAHLSYYDYIRGLSEDTLEPVMKRVGIDSHLPLVYVAGFMLVTVLDGVLIVMILHFLFLLMMSIIEARVVVLPCPVGPVIRMSPCVFRANSSNQAGSPSCSRLGMYSLKCLAAMESEFLCWKIFMRNLPRSGTL